MQLLPATRTAALTAVLAMGLAASPALGATAGSDGTNVHFTADSSDDPNDVVVSPAANGFRIRDQENMIGSGSCSGGGTNEVVCGGTHLTVNLGERDDRVVLNIAARVFGGEGADNITGSLLGDTLMGSGGAGADGNDVIDARAGNDVIDGEGGSDTLQAGTGRDAVAGGPGNDTVDGGDEDDEVSGGAGADNLAGGAGNDSVRGADNLGIGADGGDGLDGGAGNDALSGEAGDDVLAGGDGADAMAGGPGVDRSVYERVRAPVFVTLDDQADDGQPGEGDNVGSDVEDVTGGDDQNTLTGSGASNTLRGAGGEDYVDGGSAVDTLITGASGDTVRSRDGERDVVQCGDGPDFAIADSQDSVSGECETSDTGDSRPRLGRRVVVEPTAASAQGNILSALAMQLPKVNRFVPLVDKVGLPVGTVLDASTRTVALRFARRRRGARAATLSGGSFRMSQSRRSGIAQLALRGGDFGQCANRRSKDAGAAPRRRIRRLRGRTRGRHRVRGRYSSGTTRGTRWVVEDRCDGTLTRVISGRVAVRDFAKRRTIVLRRGERYLARPRRR